MRVLGVDPGTVRMGYGVLDEGETLLTVDFGVLSCPSRVALPERLYRLYLGLVDLITRYQPSEVAVEEPFVAVNVRSALALGRAQATAIIAATSQGIVVSEYSATEVKRVVADYGRSGKEQIQEMVRIQLGLPAVPQPNDAADALAVALCHIQQRKQDVLLARRSIT